LVTNPKL